MILVLSMTSSQALMALFDESAENLLVSKIWNNSDGSELAESLGKNFAELQAQVREQSQIAERPQVKITKVFGVEGPGSFTGLRVSSAFLKGLSTALNVPLVGISSYDLFGESFAFSLRPAKAANLSVDECVEREFKFLQIDKSKTSVVARPSCKIVLGLQGNPYWPSLVEVQHGLKLSLQKQGFGLNYGYAPEFVKLKTV